MTPKYRIWSTTDKAWVSAWGVFNYVRETASLSELFTSGQERGYVFHQFTGLLSRFGTNIYQGDLIFADEQTFEVVFYLGAFMLLPVDDREGNHIPLYEFMGDSDVIGNVFDNPDLALNT